MTEYSTGRHGNLVIRRVTGVGDDCRYMFWFQCPGCDEPHAYYVPRWSFNGDFVRPTFTPSLLLRWGDERRCHLFVTDGMIRYCPDSTHKLAGATVPLPEPPEWLFSGEDVREGPSLRGAPLRADGL